MTKYVKTLIFKAKLQLQYYMRRFVTTAIVKNWTGKLVLDSNAFKWGSTRSPLPKSAVRIELADLAKKQRKIIRQHFKDNDYALDLQALTHEVLIDYFGFNYESYINHVMLNKLNLNIELRLNGTFITKKRGK